MGNTVGSSTKNLLILLMLEDEDKLISVLKEDDKERTDFNLKINKVALAHPDGGHPGTLLRIQEL